MQQLLAVGVGGFLGAIARHMLTGLMHRRFPAFMPAGTLLVNVLGCLSIGVLMALVVERRFPMESETVRLLLITGFLGSLTTFSTFGYETINLLRDHEIRFAFLNLAGNVVICFLAVWLGWLCVKAAG